MTISQKYSPDQPRVPAGNPDGGQWTNGGDGGNSHDATNDGSRPIHLTQEIPPVFDPELPPLPGMGSRPLPENPNDLLDQGYEDTSHPNAAEQGHRTFKNPDTGDTLRFDQGEPDQPGFGGQDHYHRYNPDSTGDGDMYLDRFGKPVPKNSNPSHLFPGEIA